MLNEFFEIHLTKRCNLSCIHCREGIQNSPDISMDLFSKIVDDISDFPAERKFISLSGGEPTLHPLFPEFVKKAYDTGFETNIVTNGTLIDKKMVDELFLPLKDNLVFSVSIDGDEKIHNKIRCNDNAYSDTITAIGLLTDAGIEVEINYTLNDLNYHCLEYVYNLSVDLKVNSLKVRIPLECGNVDYSMNPFSKHKEYLSTLSKAAKLAETSYEKHGLQIESNDPLWLLYSTSSKEQIRIDPTENDLGGCTAGWLQVCINNVGDVHPCAYLNEKMGNVNNTSLIEVVYNWQEKLIQLIERDNLEKCNICSLKKYCGGCRARALANKGSILAEDPLCPLS